MFKFFRFLNSSLDKLYRTKKSIPFFKSNGIEGDLFKRKLAYPCEKFQDIESFYKPLK